MEHFWRLSPPPANPSIPHDWPRPPAKGPPPEALGQIAFRCLTVMEYGLPELEKDLVAFLRKQ